MALRCLGRTRSAEPIRSASLRAILEVMMECVACRLASTRAWNGRLPKQRRMHGQEHELATGSTGQRPLVVGWHQQKKYPLPSTRSTSNSPRFGNGSSITPSGNAFRAASRNLSSGIAPCVLTKPILTASAMMMSMSDADPTHAQQTHRPLALVLWGIDVRPDDHGYLGTPCPAHCDGLPHSNRATTCRVCTK
jgi:hypothetical protein